jgi:hypothetical protein
VRTVAGSSVTVGFQDGLPGIARIGVPKGIWSDMQYVYFLDDSLRRINNATGEVTTWVGRALRLSQGNIPSEQFSVTTLTGGNGYLYAISGYAVYKVSLATREITHLAGAFNERGTKDGSATEARFAYPSAIFSLGRSIFVTDSGMNAVRRIDADTGNVTTIAKGIVFPGGLWADGNYLYVVNIVYNATLPGIYRIDLSTSEVVPFVTGLPEARSLWGDGQHLYITGWNHTIRKVNMTTGEVSIVTGAEARLDAPNSIWSDGRFLFITDKSTVRAVNPVSGETYTIAGTPQLFGTENGAGAEAHFDFSLDGISGDGVYLYVGDHAIRRVTIP